MNRLNPEIPIFLAPLAGYTDSPFRRVVRSFGAGIVFTEMVSVMGIKFKDKNTLGLLKFYPEEHPIFVQLFGSDIDAFAHASKFVTNLKFDGIDINAGCPVPKIVKDGSGSYLLKDLTRLAKIVHAVKSSSDLPVSLKVRKGFNKGENVLSGVLKIAENEGVSFLTIHAITTEEGFKKESEDWDAIAEIVAKAKIPIVANGGVEEEEDVKALFEKTNAPYVMIGRATIGRPWFLKSSYKFLKENIKLDIPNKEKIDIIVRHIESAVEFYGEEKGIVEMRKHFIKYARGIRRAAEFRRYANSIKTKEEAIALVRAFFDETEVKDGRTS
ncbi:putative tRNA-dihydrouridine synthase [Caldisericum exile AZM16c01]|uniref:tRNA-dihydrouridine synthase n=1 Tax=Caldisericum exile (strain DSM 21853 / NBRC 104410 / AZM16c01) TaxID=511051 RepID=A0A7U6GFF8_CALEA|nr:putative tRNA-dihydrouridine synthase [Caldisericum exile AZM16c01]